MAKFLAYQGRLVAHDLGAFVESVDDFLTEMGPNSLAGTVETGAVLGWELVARAWPDTKFVVIWRKPREVIESLKRVGLEISADDLEDRVRAMDELANHPGTLTLTYSDLDRPKRCAMLFEHCLAVPFDWQWWKERADVNEQIDIPRRVAHLASRREKAAALRAEVSERIKAPRPFEWIGFEPWDGVAAEVVTLAGRHYEEAEDRSRTFHPDMALFSGMARAGLLFVVTVRVDGELVGYCIWTRELDTEATGGLVFVQGPWFVKPGCGAGIRLLLWPFDRFRAAGVTHLRLHHTMQGRGAKAGTLFQRIGAVEAKREYLLRLGGGDAQH